MWKRVSGTLNNIWLIRVCLIIRGVYGSDEMISGVWLLIEMFRSHVMTQFLNSNLNMKLRRKLTSFRGSSELEVPFNHEVVYFFNFQLFLSSGIFDFMCIFILNVSHWSWGRPPGRPPGRPRCDLVLFSEAELLIFNISLFVSSQGNNASAPATPLCCTLCPRLWSFSSCFLDAWWFTRWVGL